MPEATIASPRSQRSQRSARHSRGAGSGSASGSLSDGLKLDDDSHKEHGDALANGQPTKKKQKRNKPTLSCSECVERKTKCDRTRPACLSCIKRGTECRYTAIANLIASANNGATRPTKPKKQARPSISTTVTTQPSTTASPGQLPTPISYNRSGSISSSHSSPFLLSNVPHTKTPSASVFGISSEHPFANYWTTAGGVPEVVGVLPNKDHADLLVAKYFEAIDPVYPMLNRQRFYADYHRFWESPKEVKETADASMLALHFAVYAMGAQFIQMQSEQEKAQIAEFYVSAAHQSLRLYPFLSRTSLRSIQAMVLIKYFLMNDNKAADAWAFGGILIEQAYAMGLNRDPDLIVPQASPMIKHLRRKLWQAVYFQDTFLTVLLKLPPTTTFSDVSVDSLTEEPVDPTLPNIPSVPLVESQGLPTASTNPMSISNIAPQQASPVNAAVPGLFIQQPSIAAQNDIAFIRSMWQLADLVQTTVCVPRALSRPIAQSPKHKAQLLTSYRNLYNSFPHNLTNTNKTDFRALAAADPRQSRQSLFLRSNYWHCVMLIEADENEAGGVKCDVRGALEAGSVAVNAFFDFWDNLRVDAGVWWVFQHRAFEEALTMANLLADVQFPPPSPAFPNDTIIEPVFRDAKENCRIALDLLEHVGSTAPEMQKTRTEVLRNAYEQILW